MHERRATEATPSLSVLAAQGGRVTGKTAKERPRRDRERKSFDYYLRRSYHDPYYNEPYDEETNIFQSGKVDTLA